MIRKAAIKIRACYTICLRGTKTRSSIINWVAFKFDCVLMRFNHVHLAAIVIRCSKISLSHNSLVDKYEIIDVTQPRRHFHDYFKLQKITLRINVRIRGVHTDNPNLGSAPY
jgi:hypothetical protein